MGRSLSQIAAKFDDSALFPIDEASSQDDAIDAKPATPRASCVNVAAKGKHLRKLMTGSRSLVSTVELAHERRNGLLCREAASELKRAMELMSIEVEDLCAFLGEPSTGN